MVHVVFIVEARPLLPNRAYFLADVGDDLSLKVKYTEQNSFVQTLVLLFSYYYLEMLVGEAAAWTAGALDPENRCTFIIAHFQERGEHAPPERAQSDKQLFKHSFV